MTLEHAKYYWVQMPLSNALSIAKLHIAEVLGETMYSWDYDGRRYAFHQFRIVNGPIEEPRNLKQ